MIDDFKESILLIFEKYLFEQNDELTRYNFALELKDRYFSEVIDTTHKYNTVDDEHISYIVRAANKSYSMLITWKGSEVNVNFTENEGTQKC
jgi:hypothetical protein